VDNEFDATFYETLLPNAILRGGEKNPISRFFRVCYTGVVARPTGLVVRGRCLKVKGAPNGQHCKRVNSMKKSASFVIAGLLSVGSVSAGVAAAQDLLPRDNGISDYHTAPRWRESESHPLRVLAYIVHPIGWVLREGIFRPLSHFAGSTEVTRSVMGFREPFDYRDPECFSSDDTVPDCRSVIPFNYDQGGSQEPGDSAGALQQRTSVYFPNVNFDFDRRSLNDLGRGKARVVADLLKQDSSVRVVLEGHADFMGSDSYNQKLGMDRAEALRTELVRLGVSSDRLSTVTFGESRPLVNEETDEARAVNRRVEVHVEEGSGSGSTEPK
jgi:outer membrane protein OmpA-like peptidoglycan-associated protein